MVFKKSDFYSFIKKLIKKKGMLKFWINYLVSTTKNQFYIINQSLFEKIKLEHCEAKNASPNGFLKIDYLKVYL